MNQSKLIMWKQLKWILDELFSIWHGQYQPTELYLSACFSSLAQASFFLIFAGDSVGTGYHPCIMPRPGLYMYIIYIINIQIFTKIFVNNKNWLKLNFKS